MICEEQKHLAEMEYERDQINAIESINVEIESSDDVVPVVNMEILFWLYLLIFTFSRFWTAIVMVFHLWNTRFDGILMFTDLYHIKQVWLMVRQYQNNVLQTNARHSRKISRKSTIEQTTGVSLNGPNSNTHNNSNNNDTNAANVNANMNTHVVISPSSKFDASHNNNTNNSNKQRPGSVNSGSNRVFFNNVSATGAENSDARTHLVTSQINLRIVQILHVVFESIPLCILQSVHLIRCNQQDNTDSIPHQNNLTIMVIVSVFSCLIVAWSKYVAIEREFFDYSLKSLECKCRNGCCCCHRYSLWIFPYFNIGYLATVTWIESVLNIISRLCLYILLWSVVGPICVLLFIIITLIILSILANLMYFVKIKKNTLYDFLFFSCNWCTMGYDG